MDTSSLHILAGASLSGEFLQGIKLDISPSHHDDGKSKIVYRVTSRINGVDEEAKDQKKNLVYH